MEYETVGAAVDGSAVGQPKYKVKSKRKPLEVVMNTIFFLCEIGRASCRERV